MSDSDVTYKVVRLHFDENHPDHRKVMATGLTLEDAQEWCNRDDTHDNESVDENGRHVTLWFDGYYEEG